MPTKINLNFETEIYRRYYPLVFSTCRRFLIHKNMLEDAIQSVFLLYIKKEDHISSNLSSWFYWASVNICKVVNLEAKKHEEKSIPISDSLDITNKTSTDENAYSELGIELEKLPTKKKNMLLMRFYENLSYREIGSNFNCSEESVRKTIERTILYLENQIKRKDILTSAFFLHFFAIDPVNIAQFSTKKFILQNSLFHQSLIKGVQKMIFITKLKIILVCFALTIPIAIPLSNHLFAESESTIEKQINEVKKEDIIKTNINQSIDLSLQYLAKSQLDDGSWKDTTFKNKNILTALSCLAFLSEGSRPQKGKYSGNLAIGIEYLLSTMRQKELVEGQESNSIDSLHEYILTAAVFLICYKEMNLNTEIKSIVTNAVDILSRAQKTDGGWDYDFYKEGKSNLTMTANVLWYIKLSNKNGILFPDELIKKGIDFSIKCAYPDGKFRNEYGQFRNEIRGTPTHNLFGLGIIALNKNGNLNNPLIEVSKSRILDDINIADFNELKSRPNYLFDCFYNSMAMYAIGNDAWNSWFTKNVEFFKLLQKESGELLDEQNNSIYTTAIAAIVMQAPNEKIAIYEKGYITPPTKAFSNEESSKK